MRSAIAVAASSRLDAGILVAGAAVFAACSGWPATRTGAIRWSVASHTLTGLVRVVG